MHTSMGSGYLQRAFLAEEFLRQTDLFRPVIDSANSQARTELLGPVSYTHYCASTPGLST